MLQFFLKESSNFRKWKYRSTLGIFFEETTNWIFPKLCTCLYLFFRSISQFLQENQYTYMVSVESDAYRDVKIMPKCCVPTAISSEIVYNHQMQ